MFVRAVGLSAFLVRVLVGNQVLVSAKRLVEICREVIETNKDIFSTLNEIPDDIWSYISNEVAAYFQVNSPVVEIRA